MVNIKLKWNKSVFEKVPLDPDQPVTVFKDCVYELTKVPQVRQKLMAKGAWTGILKDEEDLCRLTIKEGQQVLLMGTAEVVAVPKATIKFVEDLDVEELAKKGAIIPAGLSNLGNTCYMNATIECLRYMPELRQALQSSQIINLSSLLRATFDELDRSGSSIPPYTFVHNLRTSFPQFAETNQGRFMQQDAEEFYNALCGVVQRDVDRTSTPFNTLLGVELEEKLSCQESTAETPVIRFESVNKLVCNIQGGSGSATNIDHMMDGLKIGLEGSIEKNSDVLGRNALWTKTQRISSLPRYLCVQFMRFFWKATPESRDHTGVKCKILRAVSFPQTLDVYEMCNDALRRTLRHNRDKANKSFEDDLSRKRPKTLSDETASTGPSDSSAGNPKAASTTTNNSTGPESSTMETGDDDEGLDEDDLALQEALKMSMGAVESNAATSAITVADNENTADTVEVKSGTTDTVPMEESATESAGPMATLGVGLPENFTGHYELHAIVTHKGRSADSGHYMGWVRQSPGSSYWWRYDDEKVTEVLTEDIMKLNGGGDRDMAYLNFYRFKDGTD